MEHFLKRLIERKKDELSDLQKRSDASQDLAEVRAIGETLAALKEEIDDAEKQLAELNDNISEAEGDDEARAVVPSGAVLRNSQVLGSFTNENAAHTNDLNYRQAFMEYVLKNVPIPAELRADASTLTSDVSSVIPVELVNQIIEKMDNVGMILPLITKTSYAAGVTIPTSSVKPTATWVSEGAGSDRQKKTTGSIVFTYHKLRCEISMSMEVGTMAYAIENAGINGTDTGDPTGILKETPAAGQALTIKNGAIAYADLCAWEAAIPEEYEATAKWCMSKKSFLSLMSITDNNGQPIARVNYGVDGKVERTILGRDVVLASRYMPNLAAATANTFAFAFDFPDYCLNTVYDMGISKKQDWETEDLLTKAVMSVDGKVVSKESLVTVSNTLSV